MSRISVWALIAIIAALSGCSMCCSPFDYCGPVSGPNGQPNCDFGARRNSAFHPMADSADTYDTSVDVNRVGPTPAAAPPSYDDAGPQELPPPQDMLEEETSPVVR